MNKQSGNVLVWTLIVITVIGLAIWWAISAHINWVKESTAVVDIKVTEKERVVESNSEARYLIFTEKEVFENTDSWYHEKYNSSDVYGQLKPGKEYKCEVYGVRKERYSWYRNIVSCEEKK